MYYYVFMTNPIPTLRSLTSELEARTTQFNTWLAGADQRTPNFHLRHLRVLRDHIEDVRRELHQISMRRQRRAYVPRAERRAQQSLARFDAELARAVELEGQDRQRRAAQYTQQVRQTRLTAALAQHHRQVSEAWDRYLLVTMPLSTTPAAEAEAQKARQDEVLRSSEEYRQAVREIKGCPGIGL